MTNKMLSLAMVLCSTVLCVGCDDDDDDDQQPLFPVADAAPPADAPHAAALVVSCANVTPVATVAVTLPNFDSDNFTIQAGEVVRFQNTDNVTHTVTSDTGIFDVDDLTPGETACIQFNDVADYMYHCELHPEMQAHVTVE